MFRRVSLVALGIAMVVSVSACDGAAKDTLTAESKGVATSAANPASTLLTPGDVEAVTGLADLRAVPFDPTSTTLYGDVNLVDNAGNVVATMVAGDSQSWDEWLTDGYSVAEPVTPPVGEESFVGPSPDVSPTLTIFAARKGGKAILIETTVDANGEARLSTEQLRALAEVVVARL